MRQQNPVRPQLQFDLPLQHGKEIIVAHNHLQLAAIAHPVCDLIFAALCISQMDQHIDRSLLLQHARQVVILSVGIAHNQNLHQDSSSRTALSSAFMASKALPRWLIRFFSSISSSAEVFPNSGI